MISWHLQSSFLLTHDEQQLLQISETCLPALAPDTSPNAPPIRVPTPGATIVPITKPPALPVPAPANPLADLSAKFLASIMIPQDLHSMVEGKEDLLVPLLDLSSLYSSAIIAKTT